MIRKVLLITARFFVSNYLFSQMVAANDYVSTKEVVELSSMFSKMTILDQILHVRLRLLFLSEP